MQSKRVKVAISKGRILKEVCAYLAKAGYPNDIGTKESRELIFNVKNLQILACKPSDVPRYVELGAADCGIVGSDCILEAECDIYEPISLPIGKCRMVLACPKNKRIKLKAGMNIKIGTKYPRITQEFFLKKNIAPEIVFLNGSVELAPLTGLADAIVDITETGSTIKENNLKIVETIMEISAKVIVNKTSFRTLNKEIETITTALVKKIKI